MTDSSIWDLSMPSKDLIDGNAEALVRLSLPEQVAAKLRDMILKEELAPGQRIPERLVTDRLSISRTPFREALKMLAADGLIELQTNRGAVVANPGPKEIRDMLQVMGALEALAGELACHRASENQIRELRALNHEMLAAYQRDNRLAYFKVNQLIHLGIMELSGNPELKQVHMNLNARAYRVLYLSNSGSDRLDAAMEEHNEMIELLEKRDASGLAILMRRHRELAWEEVKLIMERSTPVKQTPAPQFSNT